MEITNGMIGYVPDTGMSEAVMTASRKSAEKDAAAAKKVAKDFESLFIGMMVKSMRETVGKDKLTNGGHGEEIYSSLLDQEYAKAMTESGGVGLTAMLEKQLVKPAFDAAGKQGVENHDTSNQRTKTEVTYENR